MPSIQDLFKQLWEFDPLASCSNPQTEVKEFISEREYARQIRENREGNDGPLDINDRREPDELPARQPTLNPAALINKDPKTLKRATTPIEEIPDSHHVTREDPRELAFKVDPSSNPFTCCAAISVEEPNEIDLTSQKEQQPTTSPQMIVRENSNDSDPSYAKVERASYKGILFGPL
jgi:hypothetical protein